MRWLIGVLSVVVCLATALPAAAQGEGVRGGAREGLDPRLGAIEGLPRAPVLFYGVLAGDRRLTEGRWVPVGIYAREWEARSAVLSLQRRGLAARYVPAVATPSELTQHAVLADRGRLELARLLNAQLAVDDARQGDDFDRERRRNPVTDGGFDEGRRETINNAGFDPLRRAEIDFRGFQPAPEGFGQQAGREQPGFRGGERGFGQSQEGFGRAAMLPPAANTGGGRGNFGTQGAAPAPNRGGFGTQGAQPVPNRGGFGTQPKR